MKPIRLWTPVTLKTQYLCLILSSFAALAADQAPAPATPAPPPAAPVKRSAAELEKLVAPIALYPDPLIATILPASVYPLEIVQAARFVANTNNLAKLDEQPWDPNVKAVARVPEAIKKMNDDLAWTMELGEAFLAQDKDVMDAMQSLRAKAQQAGALKTTPQQVVTVTNLVVEKTVEQKVVIVTNTIVQIQPANPQVVYVPTYNPTVVYAPPPPSGPPPVVSFAAGVAVGAIIANNCDWHHGGCWHGDVDIDIDRNVNVNRDVNVNRNANVNQNVNRNASVNATGARASSTGAQQKWQPDQSRLSKSGAPSASASTANKQARGWGSGGAAPSVGQAGARPSAGAAPASHSAPSTGASRPSTSPSVSPSSSGRASASGSAFGGASNGARASSASSRGASSRFSGGGGGRRAGR